MASKRGWASWRAIAMAQESTYDAAEDLGATDFIEHFESDPIQSVALLADNSVLIGTEAEELLEAGQETADVLAWSSQGSHVARCRPNTLALLASYALGYNSQTAIDEPDTGYYTLTITPNPCTFTTQAELDAATTIHVDDTGSFPATGTVVFDEDGDEWAYDSKTATTLVHSSTGVSGAKADNRGVRLKQSTRTMALPSTTVLDAISGSLYKKWAGVLVNNLSLSATRKDWVRISADLVGSGTVTTPGAPTQPTAITDETYLKAGDCAIDYGDGDTWNGRTWDTGNDTTVTAQVKSFAWNYSNNLDDVDDYLMGGGQYRERGEAGRRTQTLTLELEKTANTWLGFLTGQTLCDLRLSLDATGEYGAKLYFPRIYLTGHSAGGGTSIIATTNEIAVQQHSTYGSIQLEIYNKKVGYLH